MILVSICRITPLRGAGMRKAPIGQTNTGTCLAVRALETIVADSADWRESLKWPEPATQNYLPAGQKALYALQDSIWGGALAVDNRHAELKRRAHGLSSQQASISPG